MYVQYVPDLLRLSVVADADNGAAGRLDDLRDERQQHNTTQHNTTREGVSE